MPLSQTTTAVLTVLTLGEPRDVLVVCPSGDADGLATEVLSVLGTQVPHERLRLMCLWFDVTQYLDLINVNIARAYAEPVAPIGTLMVVTVASKCYEVVQTAITRALSATSPGSIIVISRLAHDVLRELLRQDFPESIFSKICIVTNVSSDESADAPVLDAFPGSTSVKPSCRAVPALVQHRRASARLLPE